MRYIYENMGRDFEVDYDFYPEDKALRINGIQAEPDYPAYFALNSVKLLGVELIDVLSQYIMEDIEEELKGGKGG